jgi:hypothetical protein
VRRGNPSDGRNQENHFRHVLGQARTLRRHHGALRTSALLRGPSAGANLRDGEAGGDAFSSVVDSKSWRVEVMEVEHGGFLEGINQFVNKFNQSLDYIEQIINSFNDIFKLEIREQALDISKKLNDVIELYYYDTVDSEESLTSAFDLDFSELEYKNRTFSQSAKMLNESIKGLETIYRQFILGQSIVIIVSSLEAFLSGIFSHCLMQNFQQNSLAVNEITGRYNFQNWGNTVVGYRTFLNIDLGEGGNFSSRITMLQQKRHVLIHQAGVIDKRAVKQLNLPNEVVGKNINITEQEVREGIKTAREFSVFLQSATQNIVG